MEGLHAGHCPEAAAEDRQQEKSLLGRSTHSSLRRIFISTHGKKGGNVDYGYINVKCDLDQADSRVFYQVFVTALFYAIKVFLTTNLPQTIPDSGIR